jgi:glycerol dehydrogenase
MDTQVVANAPKRLFVAGMGDALATMFEARASVASGAKNLVGGLSTRAALGLTELCYEILMEEGRKALQAVEAGVLTEAVDQVIEASTYLSGVGAESSGLAAAHAVHNGMTALEETHEYLHGEKVAFGVITQLVLENAPQEELDEVLDFCMDIGLPVTLAELGVKEPDEAGLRNVAELAVAEGDTGHNEPFAVDADMYYAAIVAADKIGTDARAKRNA